jgi:hypothetical protein
MSDEGIQYLGSDRLPRTVGVSNPLPVSVQGLDIPDHDYIGCTYTGDNLTGVVYKTGGSGGTTVATLTLAYSGSNLTSVTRS